MPDLAEKSEEPKEDLIATKGLDLSFAETSWGFKGQNYLFTIGIDKYPYWPPLKCAVKDVEDFGVLLSDRYQFDRTYWTALKNEEATEQNILIGFKQIAQKITEEDNLIIYFSGHGHYDEVTKTGYWIPVNAMLGDDSEYQFINTAIIVDKLRNINTLHTFLIIDACFSGALLHQNRSKPKSERYKSRVVLASGRAEVVSDGPEGGNSPFAKGILNTLRLNTDKFISASKLILEVKEYVEKEAQQTPTDARLRNSDDMNGDFVFHLKMSEAEIWASVVQQDTKEAYRKFIDQFPDSQHLAEAQESSDWLEAQEKNTRQSLSTYLSQYQPDGKYMARAIQALNVIEEEACWQKASAKDTLAAYFDYLSKFTPGSHMEEAHRRIDRLRKDEDDTAFKKALEKDTPDAYQDYLTKSKDKKYQQEAEKKLSAISLQSEETPQERSVWETAQKAATYQAYRDFVKAFPESRFLEEAHQEMKRMDDVALNQIRFVEYNRSLSLPEKIKRCIAYFNDFPGADNNVKVKQIKDRLEMLKYRGGH